MVVPGGDLIDLIGWEPGKGRGRIHKGGRNLLTTPQGSSEQDSKAGTRQWWAVVMGEARKCGNVWNFPFLVPPSSCKEPIGQLWPLALSRWVTCWAGHCGPPTLFRLPLLKAVAKKQPPQFLLLTRTTFYRPSYSKHWLIFHSL